MIINENSLINENKCLKNYIEILEKEHSDINKSNLAKIQILDKTVINQSEQINFLKNLILSKDKELTTTLEDSLNTIQLSKTINLLELNVNKSNQKIEEYKNQIKLKEEENIKLKEEIKKIKSESLNQIENKLLEELFEEIEKIKAEKEEAQEKAIDLLSEKELKNIELNEKIDKLRENYFSELSELIEKIEELKFEIDNQDNTRKTNHKLDNNDNSSYIELVRLEENNKLLNTQLNSCKLELKQQEAMFILEKNSFQNKIESLEFNYKKHIETLQELNESLQNELNKIINEKKLLHNHIEQENKGKDNFIEQNEKLVSINQSLESEIIKLKKSLSEKLFEENLKANEKYFELLHNYKLLEHTNENLIIKLSENDNILVIKEKEISNLKEKTLLLEKESKLNLSYFKKSVKEYKILMEKDNNKNKQDSNSIENENIKLKLELKNLKDLYNIQISDLDQKLTIQKLKNNKLTQLTKNTSTVTTSNTGKKFKLRENLLTHTKLNTTNTTNTTNNSSNITCTCSNIIEFNNQDIIKYLTEDNSRLNETINQLKSQLVNMQEESSITINSLKLLIKEKIY